MHDPQACVAGATYPQRFRYRILYEVDEANHLVQALRVVHAAQDDLRWRGQ